MEVIYTKDRLETEILKSLGNRCHGYFITLDTQFTTLNTDITKDLLERVRDKMVFPYVYAINAYCFGRKFKNRKSEMLRTIAAMEIGKDTQRLHSHLIMLHDTDSATNRSFDEVRDRSWMIWRRILPRAGTNMVDVKQFDKSRNWLPYITKGFTTLKKGYDFPSVMIH